MNWKRWWSYLDDCLEAKGQSAFSGALELLWRRGRLMLCSANAVYSYEERYYNFVETFEQISPTQRQAWQRILVLGMGMGSVPQILEQRFGHRAEYVLVEIDPLIVNWAKHYTLPKLQSPIHVVQADALAWLGQSSNLFFDLIVVDIFIDDQTPEGFEQGAFLEDCRRQLSPNGLLIYNRLYQNETQIQKTEDFFQVFFQATFPKTKTIKLKANKMLLGWI
jgi:spermidine synthase